MKIYTKDDYDLIASDIVKFRAPSNIALVKYWGKFGRQYPSNPSISLTLSESFTETSVEFFYNDKSLSPLKKFLFEEKENSKFAQKIEVFFKDIAEFLPFLNSYELVIKSRNSFPHSSGIASSASSMAALAMCLCEFERRITGSQNVDLQKASFLARLGSGSASRSVSGEVMVWGDGVSDNSSNDYAIDFNENISPVFIGYYDYIAIVSKNEKSVSSRKGHQLMDEHPFRDIRFSNARNNLKNIIDAMKVGDINTFINIVESEALELHGLMMNSTPSFILLEPNTLEIIKLIRKFRHERQIPICFTLDAGPNVHILFPANHKDECEKFIENSITPFTTNSLIIKDRVGKGPVLLKDC